MIAKMLGLSPRYMRFSTCACTLESAVARPLHQIFPLSPGPCLLVRAPDGTTHQIILTTWPLLPYCFASSPFKHLNHSKSSSLCFVFAKRSFISLKVGLSMWLVHTGAWKPTTPSGLQARDGRNASKPHLPPSFAYSPATASACPLHLPPDSMLLLLAVSHRQRTLPARLYTWPYSSTSPHVLFFEFSSARHPLSLNVASAATPAISFAGVRPP
ncbi:hypothetical protein IWX90DRAFT_196739 [Phyllosticta citrichinensis]|uniref:Uncharacterized protein n=1 Tax=Phyllosticta citrichinensis TaxID=1130410 RepID=A0ABR1XXN9_9PEZI